MFSNIKNELIDTVLDKVAEKVDEITGGQIKLDFDPSGILKLNGNQYVDNIMTKLNNSLEEKKLTDFSLPSQSFDFEKAIACGIILPGQANLSQGLLSGLASFCRMEDTKLEFNIRSDPLVTAAASIGIKRAAVDYALNLGMFCYSQDAGIAGILSDVRVEIELVIGRDFRINLNKFGIKYDSKLDLHFEGLEPFDDVLSTVISEELQTSVKESATEYLREKVKNTLEELAKEYQIEL